MVAVFVRSLCFSMCVCFALSAYQRGLEPSLCNRQEHQFLSSARQHQREGLLFRFHMDSPVPIPEGGRNYYATLTPGETGDLRYVISTLADRSIVGIAMARGDLQAAGDRLAHVHPLRFLLVIFLDEQMKVSVRNIRDKIWIWQQLVASVKTNFEKELSVHNILPAHIDDFCNILGVHKTQLEMIISQRHWEGLLELLIKQVPRTGDYDRYDMRQGSLARRDAAGMMGRSF